MRVNHSTDAEPLRDAPDRPLADEPSRPRPNPPLIDSDAPFGDQVDDYLSRTGFGQGDAEEDWQHN